jgi:hypothetical protein
MTAKVYSNFRERGTFTEFTKELEKIAVFLLGNLYHAFRYCS